MEWEKPRARAKAIHLMATSKSVRMSANSKGYYNFSGCNKGAIATFHIHKQGFTPADDLRIYK